MEQRALDLRTAGVPGTLQELRVRAFLDLLQERDARTAPSTGRTGPGEPGPQDGPGDGGNSGSQGPSLAALVTITVPLATLLGQSGKLGWSPSLLASCHPLC